MTNLVNMMGLEIGPSNWLRGPDSNNRYGYYECRPLIRITKKVLNNLGGDFHENIPDLPTNWTASFQKEQNQIKNIINNGAIELIKDNRLIILSSLYYDIFPNAKWIFIERNIEETFRSRFGEFITFNDWEKITSARLKKWHASDASLNALHLNYKDFRENVSYTVYNIAEFLGIELTNETYDECVQLFRPK